jgi:hypothetical protein
VFWSIINGNNPKFWGVAVMAAPFFVRLRQMQALWIALEASALMLGNARNDYTEDVEQHEHKCCKFASISNPYIHW